MKTDFLRELIQSLQDESDDLMDNNKITTKQWKELNQSIFKVIDSINNIDRE